MLEVYCKCGTGGEYIFVGDTLGSAEVIRHRDGVLVIGYSKEFYLIFK